MKLRECVKELILYSYEKNGHNLTRTARELGIGLRTLQRHLTRYGVTAEVRANQDRVVGLGTKYERTSSKWEKR